MGEGNFTFSENITAGRQMCRIHNHFLDESGAVPVIYTVTAIRVFFRSLNDRVDLGWFSRIAPADIIIVSIVINQQPRYNSAVF